MTFEVYRLLLNTWILYKLPGKHEAIIEQKSSIAINVWVNETQQIICYFISFYEQLSISGINDGKNQIFVGHPIKIDGCFKQA